MEYSAHDIANFLDEFRSYKICVVSEYCGLGCVFITYIKSKDSPWYKGWKRHSLDIELIDAVYKKGLLRLIDSTFLTFGKTYLVVPD